MATWKDATSYRRGKTQEPSRWALTGQELRVSVLKGHLSSPDNWVMHCRQFGINTLKSGTGCHLTADMIKALSVGLIGQWWDTFEFNRESDL